MICEFVWEISHSSWYISSSQLLWLHTQRFSVQKWLEAGVPMLRNYTEAAAAAAAALLRSREFKILLENNILKLRKSSETISEAYQRAASHKIKT